MVTDLDFEEIDDLMGQMSDTQSLTEAIAADVAKVSPKTAAKKAPKKTAPKKVSVPNKAKEQKVVQKNVSKPMDVSASVAPKEEKLEVKSVQKEQPKVADPKPSNLESDQDGTKVSVRILTKYAEEPEEPVYKPNPRTGRFMDFVDPKNDMTVAKKQAIISVPVATVIETHETIIETVEEINEIPETPAAIDEHDRDRLERNGLDPDATVEEMMELAEPEDEDDFLENMMNDLGEDIEEELDEATEDDHAADILSFQDRSDAFLSEVDIEKRPLGGSAVANSVIMPEKNEPTAPADSVGNEPAVKQINSKKALKQAKKDAKRQAKSVQNINTKPQKSGKAGQFVIYVALILLLAVLGGSLGALAYFSGLF